MLTFVPTEEFFPMANRISVGSSFVQLPFAPSMLLLSKRRLHAAVNCCVVRLLLNPPADLTAPKNSSRWS